MEDSRKRRASAIARELRTGSETAEGWRPVWWRGVEVGLLRRRGDLWVLNWRSGASDHWREYHDELNRAAFEVAETWALDSLARVLAMVGR